MQNPYKSHTPCPSHNTNNHTPTNTTTTSKHDLRSWLITARHHPTESPNYQSPPPPRKTTPNNTNKAQKKKRTTSRNNTLSPTPTNTPTSTQAQTPQHTITQLPGIQTTIDPPTSNNHWGDPVYPILDNTFRIISKNVNSLPTTDNLLYWRAAAAAALELEANVLCFQETNLRWDHNNHTKVTQVFRQSFTKVKLSVSSSNEPSAKEYQPGGTFTATLGNLTS